RSVLDLERAGAIGRLEPSDAPRGRGRPLLGRESHGYLTTGDGLLPQPGGESLGKTRPGGPSQGEEPEGKDAQSARGDRLRGAGWLGDPVEAPAPGGRGVEEVRRIGRPEDALGPEVEGMRLAEPGLQEPSRLFPVRAHEEVGILAPHERDDGGRLRGEGSVARPRFFEKAPRETALERVERGLLARTEDAPGEGRDCESRHDGERERRPDRD